MMREDKISYSKNKFELDGNVANIQDVYVNKNGKKILRFDLAQNNGINTQFIPIVVKGELVDTYANDIKKGDWIGIKGMISTYQKDINKDGKIYKEKMIDILAFEIIDKKNNKIYCSDGQIIQTENNEKNVER